MTVVHLFKGYEIHAELFAEVEIAGKKKVNLLSTLNFKVSGLNNRKNYLLLTCS